MVSTTELTSFLGQLFIIGFSGCAIDSTSPIARDITERNLGGVILFDTILGNISGKGNIVSPAQLRTLTSKLQSLSSTTLLITIDQEGGKVRRLKEKHGFSHLPSAAEIGGFTGYQESKRWARTTGDMLAGAGINMNFAPVADVNSNPHNPIIGKIDRSFSADPTEVTKHCEIWLDEQNRAGVMGCLKHFPGHGSSKLDSHENFVDISDTWSKNELEPYRTLIKSGQAKAIMMGHLYHRNFDDNHPASLSYRTITGYLREKMGFDGVVITDDLQMKAITSRYGLLDAIVHSLNGGADMIIIGNNLEYDENILAKAINHLHLAIQNGTIRIETLEKAYKRVQHLKDLL